MDGNQIKDHIVINEILGVPQSLDTRYLLLSGSIASITTRDHHLLTGLLDDDHTIYPLLLGRVGGQTLKGGTAVTDILKLQGTSGNGTLTSAAIQLLVGNAGATTALTVLNNGNVGIGTTNPTGNLHILGSSLAPNGTPASSGVIKIGSDAGTELQMGYLTSNYTWIQGYGGVPLYINLLGNNTVLNPTTGKVGIGTTGPTRILGIGGLVARNIGMERGTVANTAGFALTVNAGGSTVGATDKAGGQLILVPGISTGSGESGVTIQGCVAGTTGTADRSMQDMVKTLGNKLGFFNVTPVVRPTALTPTGTYVLNTGDAGSDTEITLMRTRINELETKLQSLGLLT